MILTCSDLELGHDLHPYINWSDVARARIKSRVKFKIRAQGKGEDQVRDHDKEGMRFS